MSASASAPTPAPSPDVLAAPLAEETVLLHLVSKRYYQLNEAGAEIWDALAAGGDRGACVARLVRVFDVGPEEAAAAVDAFLVALGDRALLRGP